MISDLDRFHRCPVPGCEWEISPNALRCYLHRGPALAQFQLASDGAIIATKFMPREQDPNFDPLDAA